MSEAIKGACLCGRVQYQVSGPFDAFHLCHCSQCRRSTGSAHAANIFTSEDRLEWLAGEEFIKRYTPDEADVISKCFCTHCGSLVPYTISTGATAPTGTTPDCKLRRSNRVPTTERL
jgi:hypothetical protein